MSLAQLADARVAEEAKLKAAQDAYDKLAAEHESINQLILKKPLKDDVSGHFTNEQYYQREADLTAQANVADAHRARIEEIDAAAAKVHVAIGPVLVVPGKAAPAKVESPARVESVVEDLGDAEGKPIAGGRRTVIAAIGAGIVVLLIAGGAIALRPTTTATVHASPSPPATIPTAASTGASNVTSAARATHAEASIVPAGGGCDRPGSVHFSWTVRDASPGDKVMVTLTGPGMPATADMSLPADLKPVLEVPVPLRTSGRWTGRITSIAGASTDSSTLWQASTSLTCNA